jgi:hypothetical protein
MATTLIFGTFMKMTQECLLGEPEHDKGGFHDV